MTGRKKRNHTASFKAKVALAALKGDKPPDEVYFGTISSLPQAA